MKKLKLLPMFLMLIACLGSFGLGIYAGSPSSNTVTGNVGVNTVNAKVYMSVYAFDANGIMAETPFINRIEIRHIKII